MSKCSGDCRNCSIFQRGYCASQLSYNIMNQLAILQASIDKFKENDFITPSADEGVAQKVDSRNLKHKKDE